MISDAGGSEEMIKCATRYPCSVCKRMSQLRLRRPVSVPRTRQYNDTLLADVHFWNCQGREVLVYSMIDYATRFHVTQILSTQSARDLYEAIMTAWVKWAGAPRFLLVDPHRSHLARQFIELLGAQGTTVLVGAPEVSWTRGLVERHGACVRSMVEKLVHDGVPDDMSAQSLFDKATSAKNIKQNSRTCSMSPLCVVPAVQTSEIHGNSVGTRQQLMASVKTRHERLLRHCGSHTHVASISDCLCWRRRNGVGRHHGRFQWTRLITDRLDRCTIRGGRRAIVQ